jgi:uncharacterized protein (TIGR02145 family)
MRIRNLIKILVLIIISVFLYSCCEVTLPGDITGIVTDTETGEPVQAATVKINQTNDSTSTGNDGRYLIKNIAPGEYEIQVTKYGYYTKTENVEVLSAETQTINFNIVKIPLPEISVEYLDFCLNSSLFFNISNTSTEPLTFAIKKSQSWITVSPSAGVIGNETAIFFNVAIDRAGLSTDTIKESITLISVVGADELPDIKINIYLNGCYDPRTNINHKVIKIGSQIWMKENLSVTRYTDGTNIPVVEGNSNWSALTATDKACCWYNNDHVYKGIYGVLYTWSAAMNGAASSSASPSGVQGVCTTGWHIPSLTEWSALVDYLANNDYGCGNMEYSVVKSLAATSGWDTCLNQPCAIGYNQWSNNSSGFTARPGGVRSYDDGRFLYKGAGTVWNTATEFNAFWTYGVSINSCDVLPIKLDEVPFYNGSYVRCLKDPI